jgi:MFS family permease
MNVGIFSTINFSVMINSSAMTFSRLLRFPPALSDDLKSNFIQYFWDIAWWGLYTGGTASFLNIYAVRCGATPEQIGLLTALPALVSLLLALPFGRILQKYSAKRATLWSCFGQRILFVVYALLPWILPSGLQVGAILVLAVISAVPTTVVGISFTQLLISAIPSGYRGMVVGTRIAIWSMVSFLMTMLSGQILTLMAFPGGYQVVFFIGFIGGIMTLYHLAKVRVLAGPEIPAANQSTVRGKKLFPVVDTRGRSYIRVIAILFLFNMTGNMIAPLVPDLLVNQLFLSDKTISIGTAAGSMLVFIISMLVARMTRRIGNRMSTAVGAILLAFQSIALALAQDVTLYFVAVLVGGIALGILNVAQYNYHLDNVPQAEQSTWLSWNMLLGNAAILLGSLAGPLAARVGGAPAALICFGVLRFVMGLIILRWG